jgi:hypothetical protein
MHLVVPLDGWLMSDVAAQEVQEAKMRTGQAQQPMDVGVRGAGAGRGSRAVGDIGETMLFVGVNVSICMSMTKHSELRVGCLYYYTYGLWHRHASVGARRLQP